MVVIHMQLVCSAQAQDTEFMHVIGLLLTRNTWHGQEHTHTVQSLSIQVHERFTTNERQAINSSRATLN